MISHLRKVLKIAFPVLLMACLLSACGSAASTSGSQGSQKLTPMTLALDWTPNTNHTGIYVALAKNWYREQGIDLKILPYSSSVTPETLVSGGKADVGISSTESVVSSSAAGQPVVSIAAIIEHNTSALVTLASPGLTRPRDLDGKVYGGFGAPYESPVISKIISNDGGKGTFKNVTLDVDAMQALESHRIDFAWVFEGWEVIQAQRQGIKLNIFRITNYGVADYYTPNIISSPTEMKQKSDLLHKFMTATAKGYEYARTHAKEAAQDLIDQTPKGTFPDTGLVQASQEYLSPRYADPGRAWGMQDSSAWHSYPQFILDSGDIKDAAGKPVKSLNFDTLYTNQFLQ